MKPELIITADGSPTLFIKEWNEHYHSIHGAVRESKHVFIEAGLHYILEKNPQPHILEIGLGTGFNALLTLADVLHKKAFITYTALEPFPPDAEVIAGFNAQHLEQLGEATPYFQKVHHAPWDTEYALHPHFILIKRNITLHEYAVMERFDLIYFDAFAPRVQPELWTDDVFSKMFAALRTNGALVTYCAKGEVRRSMVRAGFKVERLQGPPGKREMLRAIKV